MKIEISEILGKCKKCNSPMMIARGFKDRLMYIFCKNNCDNSAKEILEKLEIKKFDWKYLKKNDNYYNFYIMGEQ